MTKAITSASLNRCPENVAVEAVVILELAFRDIEGRYLRLTL